MALIRTTSTRIACAGRSSAGLSQSVRSWALQSLPKGIEALVNGTFSATVGYLMRGYWFAKPAFKALAEVPVAAWKSQLRISLFEDF